jgi:hypothetical protein
MDDINFKLKHEIHILEDLTKKVMNFNNLL